MEEEKHTLTSIPTDMYGRKYTHHAWRIERVKQLSSQETWREFRKLREASEMARYLTHPGALEAHQPQFLSQPAYLTFEETKIRALVRSLDTVRKGLKFEIVVFIEELGICNELEGDDLEDITHFMLRFSGKADFLHNGRRFLQDQLSEGEMAVLEGCMQTKKYSFTN
jgi:hypothetical protein